MELLDIKNMNNLMTVYKDLIDMTEMDHKNMKDIFKFNVEDIEKCQI